MNSAWTVEVAVLQVGLSVTAGGVTVTIVVAVVSAGVCVTCTLLVTVLVTVVLADLVTVAL